MVAVPASSGHLGSRVEYVSRYWGLTQKNGDGLHMGVERILRKEESWVHYNVWWSPQGVKPEMEDRTL